MLYKNIQRIASSIILSQVREELAFEQWLKGKKFKNDETKQQVIYYMLPIKQKLEIKKNYETELNEIKNQNKVERQKIEEQQKIKKQEEIEKRKKLNLWNDSKIERALKTWAKSSKVDLGDDYESSIPDLAESFLYQPGVKEYLSEKKKLRNLHSQREYIADILASF